MLYLLTQHSLWNRTHHPFLLCTCKRGEGVVDSDHQCKILSHEDQLNFWNRSFRRWNDKIQRSGPENYSIKKHMDWIDVHNFGISHFGLHPDEMPISCIRFDVFHIRCAITRRLMTYLQKFLLETTTDVNAKFSTLLLKFWSEYNVLIWNMNLPFTSFVGLELLNFVKNSDLVVSFLKKKLL